MVGDVLNVIRDLANEGMTMVIVTHEMDFAMSISDRVVFMENGLIQLDATPEVIRCNAAAERVRRFMGINTQPTNLPAAAGHV
ncbi:Glutamine transport ATP-binding protein GlnQ [compost metagenome]